MRQDWIGWSWGLHWSQVDPPLESSLGTGLSAYEALSGLLSIELNPIGLAIQT